MKYTPKQYAQALRAASTDGEQFRKHIEHLRAFAQALAHDETIRQFFVGRFSDASAAIRVLDATFASADRAVCNVIKLLARSHALARLPQVITAADLLADTEQGVFPVLIESAVTLTGGQQEQVSRELSRQWGKEIRSSYRVDASLIGGLRITRMGTQRWDRSVLGALQQLRRVLCR